MWDKSNRQQSGKRCGVLGYDREEVRRVAGVPGAPLSETGSTTKNRGGAHSKHTITAQDTAAYMAASSNLVVNFAVWHDNDKFPFSSVRQGTQGCSIRALLGSRIHRPKGVDDALHTTTTHASTARATRRKKTQENDERKVFEPGDTRG